MCTKHKYCFLLIIFNTKIFSFLKKSPDSPYHSFGWLSIDQKVEGKPSCPSTFNKKMERY